MLLRLSFLASLVRFLLASRLLNPVEALMSAKTVAQSFRLAFVTDVEGNLDYFGNFVSHASDVLRIVEKEGGEEQDFSKRVSWTLDLVDPETCYFVYGGDVVDKGPGDIRLCRALVDLKRRYPDRVYLIVGNRDLNKLRFTAELSETDLQRPIHEIPPPHWDPMAPTLKEFLQSLPNTESSSLEELNTRVNRLHYLLQHTLGCSNTFDFRREELAILNGVDETSVTDDDVVDSFLFEVEKGSLADYLSLADVAVCIGNTLFCHGAVDKATMRYVPSITTRFIKPVSPPAPGAIIDNVQEWTAALNTFLRQGLEDYRQRPYWNEDRTSRGGECLMALQNRPAVWGRSIVSNCYGDGGCITTEAAMDYRRDPERLERAQTDALAFEKVCSDPFDLEVADWLLKDGIQRVVVGHKPTGDCPAVLNDSYTLVEIVSSDTSFSDTSAPDNRGAAATATKIVGVSPWDNQLVLQGTLRDGQLHVGRYSRLSNETLFDDDGDPHLGSMWNHNLTSGWWIKSRVADIPETLDLQDRLFLGFTTSEVEASAKSWESFRRKTFRVLQKSKYASTSPELSEESAYYLTRGSGRNVEYTTVSAILVSWIRAIIHHEDPLWVSRFHPRRKHPTLPISPDEPSEHLAAQLEEAQNKIQGMRRTLAKQRAQIKEQGRRVYAADSGRPEY